VDSEHPATLKMQMRREMRMRRSGISSDAADRVDRSTRLWCSILGEIAARVSADAPAVMLFESFPTEPDTGTWLADARMRGWAVFVPEVDGADLRVMPGDVDPRVLDVVVVPGLAFTRDGRRLGQGGGHYDRLISRLGPHCLTVGACYAEQLVDELPTETHDRTVHVVVTDAENDSATCP
jgi:5-formyltetrahydrofolate cyclo-ligase